MCEINTDTVWEGDFLTDSLNNEMNEKTTTERVHEFLNEWLKAVQDETAYLVKDGGYVPSLDEPEDSVVAQDLSRMTQQFLKSGEGHSAEVSLRANSRAKMTEEQAEALRVLKSGGNCFLTGSAGTGKSFVLSKFIDSSRSVLVTASTGIAAVRLGGRTLHSVFRIPTRVIAPEECDIESGLWQRLTRSESYRLIHVCDTVIIDEISMVRSDTFKWVASVLRAEEEYTGHHIQLVCCGDFFQLPPVISKEEKALWDMYYPENPKGYSFLSPEWEALDIRMIELNDVVRQQNRKHSAALNLIRCGDPDGTGRKWILENSAKEPVSNGITVCGTREDAERINQSELAKITPQPIKIDTVLFGDEKAVSKSNMTVEPVLHLAKGARVMTIINDPMGRYQNGSLGTVQDIIHDDREITYIRVRMDDTDLDVDIAPHKWEVKRPECVDLGDGMGIRYSLVSEYIQFPLRLAWACTIHKSQGATYKAANVMTDRVWASGQLYVGLSRCSDIKRMYINGTLSNAQVVQSPEVLKFYAEERAKNAAVKHC